LNAQRTVWRLLGLSVMIKTHTAKSLGKYLGRDVIYHFDGQKDKSRLSAVFNSGTVWLRHEKLLDLDVVQAENIYPILKTCEKLLEPMIHDGKQIIPIKYIYLQLYYTVSKECWESIRISDSGIWSIDGCLVAPDFQMLITMVSSTPQIIERLIELGFGAIKDESSPTGYRDLFGYVCEVER
jgi:hypothetical protein